MDDIKYSPIIVSCREWADEKVKCTNMLAVIDIAIVRAKKETEPDNHLLSTLNFLQRFWSLKLGMIPYFVQLVKSLEFENEDIDRFIRHNSTPSEKVKW